MENLVSLMAAGLLEEFSINLFKNRVLVRFSKRHILVDIVKNCCTLCFDIYCLMNKMVADGKSVVMISSEMPELLGMCDRIYVMNEGKLLAELNASETTQEEIMGYIIRDS